MTRIVRKLEVPYPVTDMFSLVCDVRGYPRFLPWFGDIDVIDEYQTPGLWRARARTMVHYAGISCPLVTAIDACRLRPCVQVGLIDGPLRFLENRWLFTETPRGCLIDFFARFEFSNRMLRALSAAGAHVAGDRLTDRFVQEARRRFGRPRTDRRRLSMAGGTAGVLTRC